MNRGWPRALVVVEVIVAVAATTGVLAGVVLVLTDRADGTQKLDGLATFLGLLVGGVALLVLVTATVLALLTRRALRSDDVRLRRLAGALPTAIAVVWLVGVGVAAVQGAEAPGVTLSVLAGLVLLVPAVGTAVTSHPTV